MTIADLGHDLADHWVTYASMPVLAAVIGYVTKLVAIEMMFKPVDFRGKPPVLGWQGIIPRNAGRMATVGILGAIVGELQLHLVIGI